MVIIQDVTTSVLLIQCQLCVYASVTLTKDINDGKNEEDALERKGAAIPTALTPNRLSRMLPFPNMPAQPIPNSHLLSSIFKQGHIPNLKQQIGLPNYIQKHPLQIQSGGSTVENAAQHLLQLQKSLTPEANIALLILLANNPLQAQPPLNMQGPLHLTPPLKSQSSSQPSSPLDILDALESRSPLQLQALLDQLSPSQLQSLLQSWSPMQLLFLLQPQYPWHLSPPLKNYITTLFLQKSNLMKPKSNKYLRSTTVSQNYNNPPQTSCQQLRELLSKILQSIVPPQSPTTIQNSFPLITQNKDQHFAVNHLGLGKSPLQLLQEQQQLTGGNTISPWNLLSNLQSQSTPTTSQMFHPNFQNANHLGSTAPVYHNIINPFLAASLAMNRRQMKRSAKMQKNLGQTDLIRKFGHPINAPRIPKSFNAFNITGSLATLLQGLNISSPGKPSPSDTKSINDNTNQGSLATLLQGLNISSPGKPLPSDTKSINDNTNQGLPKTNEAKAISLKSSPKSEKNDSEIQDSKEEISLEEDNTPKDNEVTMAIPEKDNHRRQNLNSKTDENGSLSEESIVDSYSLGNPKGGLKLASQLLKEARSDLSALDDIINSYSIQENDILDLPSKDNKDNPLISQGIIETDTSDGIDGPGSLNNLKVAVNSSYGSKDKSSKKQESKINPTQFERLLKSRSETAKNSEPLIDTPSNETDTDTTIYMIYKLVNEAKTDLSKIQEELVQSLSLHNLVNKDKRESKPFQTNIIKASTLLSQANVDLGSIQESLLATKAQNDINIRHNYLKVKDKDEHVVNDDNNVKFADSDTSFNIEDSGIVPLVVNDFIGNEDKYHRSKRVLSEQNF